MSTRRAKILDGIKLRINSLYGPETGRRWFRAVWRRPWRPENILRPAVTIVDDGQRKAMATGDAEDSKQVILGYKIVIDLKENWDREKNMDDWSERINHLALDKVEGLQNWFPAHTEGESGFGLLRNDYISDDPLDVVLGDGAQRSIWMVEFEAEYFQDVGIRGKTD